MKIALVYQSKYPPIKGASGADRRMRDIARGMALSSELFITVPQWQRTGQQNTDPEIKIEYLGYSLLNKIPLINRLAFWADLVIFCIRQNINAVLLYNTTVESFIVAGILRCCRITVLAEFCDLRSSVPENAGILAKVKIKVIHLGETLLPKITNGNIVISDYLERSIRKTAPGKPLIKVPILVDSTVFYPDLEKGNRFRQKHRIQKEVLIAYVGSLWFHEGVQYLVKAFADIIENNSNIRLVIAGKLVKGPQHDDIEALAAELGITNKITFTGWLSTDEILEVFNAVDILVVPQINHEFSQAGLPTKLAEYSIMGKAIVATRVGDVPLYFKHLDNALLCNPADPENLGEALNMMIANPDLRKKLSENARLTAKKMFDYKIAVNPISVFLKSIRN